MPLHPATLLCHLRCLTSPPGPDPAPDAALLERFAGRRDKAAFAALVSRHGAMVLRVCRHVLGNVHDFVFLLAGMVAAGVGALAYPAPQAKQPPATAEQAASGPAQRKEGTTARTDRYGDPLPAGAIARLGTTRWCLDGELAHCMVVSQDGKTLLTANPTTGVAVWDMATGRLTRQLPETPELRRACLPAGAVALSADGRTAALAGSDGTVHLLDIETGKEKQRCRGHRGKVDEAALSADGRVLVTRSVDETLRVWDAVSGKQLRQAPLRRGHLRDYIPRVELALSSDAKTLAWVDESEDRLIHVCETVSGKELHCLGELKEWRRRIAFSPDGRMLVATSDEGPGLLWDVKTGKRIRELPHWRKYEFVPTAFTPDSKALIFTLGGDAMRLLDVQTGKELWRVDRRTSSTILDVFAFALDGKTLIVGNFSGGPVLHRYDTSTGKRLLSPLEPIAALNALAFAPDERALYSLGEDEVLRSWNAATGKELARVDVGTSQGLFSPDSRLLVAHKRGASHLYDTATGKELRRLPSNNVFGSGAFSPDGEVLALPQWRDSLLLLRVATGKELCRIADPPSELSQVAFTPGGQELIGHPGPGFGRGGPVHFWDLPSGRQRRRLDLPPHWGSVALSPDGKTLAVPLQNFKSIDFLEVATGQKRFTIDPPTIWPCAIGYSPDGRLFLVGNRDGSVRFHDAYSGQLLLRREGHRGTVVGWAFSRSGRTMATLSRDRTALVWSMPDLHRGTVEKPVPLSQSALRECWADLAGKDATRAYRAIAKLAQAPEQSLPWLKEHLKPAVAADPKRLRALIADLDSPRFAVRENAARELEKQRGSAETALRQALAGKPSAEARQRLEQLLEKLENPITNPERLRVLRAVEVLEQMGSSQARELLQTLARAAPEDRLVQEAKAALERLAKQPR